MSKFAKTPRSPYYAVIFTTVKSDEQNGYQEMNARMFELAQKQKGYLGIESAKGEIGLSVTYWETPEDIANWKNHAEHQIAQLKGYETCGIKRLRRASAGLKEIIFTKKDYELHERKRKRASSEAEKCSRRRIEMLLQKASDGILPRRILSDGRGRYRQTHTVCVRVTDEFLQFSRAAGNDLSTPRPEFAFPGLEDGDKWCLCVLRWREALENGVAPEVVLEATHESALQIVRLEDLHSHALTDEYD